MHILIDIIVVLFLILLGVIGYKRGLVEELGRLLGLIAATIISLQYYLNLSGFILSVIRINPWIAVVFSFAVIFIVILLIMRMLTKLTHLLLMNKGSKIMNQGMGFLFGAVKGMFVVMVLLWVLDSYSHNEFYARIKEKSLFTKYLSYARSKLIYTFNFEDPLENSATFVRQFIAKQENQIHAPD